MNYVPKTDWLAYFFPLFKNHNYYKTWEGPSDVTDEIFMGYCFADGAEYFETPQYSDDRAPMVDVDGRYLQKIIELCQKEGIDLFVIKTPVVYSDAEHQVLNSVKQMCEAYSVMYYDMSIDATEWGFDYTKDMLNYFHNNTPGAKKVTTRLGEILTELYDFSENERHQYADVWAKELERMNAFREGK